MAWDLASLVQSATRDAFGSSVVYTRTGGTSVSLRAVFDRVFEETQIGGGMVGTANRRATLDVKLSDLSFYPASGDSVSVDGLSYTVEALEPDGQGGILLVLAADV